MVATSWGCAPQGKWRSGCLLRPALSKAILGCGHVGGLGALAPNWAECFLQSERLPAGRVPLPVTTLSPGN